MIGVIIPAKVVRVLDGDTIEVQVHRTLRIRLLDCWAPETRTTDQEEKRLGMLSKAHLQAHAINEDVIVEIPMEADGKFGDAMSMGRILGRVRIADTNQDLSDLQVAAGHATKEKQSVRSE